MSYEIGLGLSIIGALMFARTLSMSGIVEAQQADHVWYVFFQPLGFLVYMISALGETNRAPFDLPEAESELVAGYHTEYSGFRWALFFMAEYSAMIVTAAIAVTLFSWRLDVFRVTGTSFFGLVNPESYASYLLQAWLVFGVEDNAADLCVYVVSLDVAALSLRSVDGAWVEMDDPGWTCQHRADRHLVCAGVAESRGGVFRFDARCRRQTGADRQGHDLFHRHGVRGDDSAGLAAAGDDQSPLARLQSARAAAASDRVCAASDWRSTSAATGSR